MTQKQRESIIQLIGMLDGLSYVANSLIADGIARAGEMLQTLLEKEDEDDEQAD